MSFPGIPASTKERGDVQKGHRYSVSKKRKVAYAISINDDYLSGINAARQGCGRGTQSFGGTADGAISLDGAGARLL